MPQLLLDGQSVFYADGGHAYGDDHPWVILVHGSASSHAIWQQQSRGLAHHGFNVAVPDLPGHGRSVDKPELESVQAYAGWLADFIAALGAKRIFLAGHSLGACIALEAAGAALLGLAGLALLGGGLTMPVSEELLRDCKLAPDRAISFITSFGHAPASHRGGASVPGTWLTGGASALMSATAPEVLLRDFVACQAWDGSAAAAAVRVPTLIMTGDRDRMTPVQNGRALAQTIAGSCFEVVPGMGHMLPTEVPRPIYQRLHSFFSGTKVATA